jgi:hypothetical protein
MQDVQHSDFKTCRLSKLLSEMSLFDDSLGIIIVSHTLHGKHGQLSLRTKHTLQDTSHRVLMLAWDLCVFVTIGGVV